MKKVLGIITARGGSKGIPGKNIAPAGGKPLIAWTIEEALKSSSISRLVVSTDDKAIAEVSRKYGAELPFMRPSDLAGDASPHVLAVEHAVKYYEENLNFFPDYIMLLQPTTPLRIAEDIDKAAAIAFLHDADAVISVSPMTPHPYYSRKINRDGFIEDLVMNRKEFKFRQELPEAVSENGAIYMLRRDVLFAAHELMPDNAMAYLMPEERSLDIDSAWNLKLADLILSSR